MSPRGLILAAVSLAACVCWISSCALADSHRPAAHVTHVEGDVQIDRGDGQGLQPASVDLPASEGGLFRTGEDGVVKVEFDDGSNLRIVPDTVLSFDRLGLNDSGGRVTSISLPQGTVYFDLRKAEMDQSTITVGEQQLIVREASRFRVNVFTAGIKVAVIDGEVDFNAPHKMIALKKNDTLDNGETDGLYSSLMLSNQPSTLAPLEPIGPSSPIVPHWPAPVAPPPRIHLPHTHRTPFRR